MATTIDTPPDVDPQSPAARRAGWLGWWFYFVVVVAAPFALILAAAAAVYLWWKLEDIKATNKVQAEVARIQAAGEPVTIYDLYAYHRVPEGTNDITAQWAAALKLYEGKQYRLDCESQPIVGTGDAAALDAGVPNAQVLAAEAFLSKHDALVQATLAAARAEGECRFPQAFEQGEDALLRHVQQARTLARMMSVRMRVSIARGDNQASIESIAATLASSRMLLQELSLVGQLVRIAIIGVAASDIEHLLNHADLSDEQLAQLQSHVQRLRIPDGLTTGLLGERAIGYHSFHQFPPGAAARIATAARPMASGELTRPADCDVYLERLHEYIDASRTPLPQSLSDAREIGEQASAAAQTTSPLERMKHVRSRQRLPDYLRVWSFPAAGRGQALRDLTLLAIAAKRYRLKHGEYPQELKLLTEFLPEIHLDPFDGQPLRMKGAGDVLVLYSIGKDGLDNGGQDPQDRGEPDIVVRLAKP